MKRVKNAVAILLATTSLLSFSCLAACVAGEESGSQTNSQTFQTSQSDVSDSADAPALSDSSPSEKPEEEEVAPNNILKDPCFKNGFTVYKTTEGVADFHATPLTATEAILGTPSWTLAQWASKYDIINAEKKSGFGEATFTNTETTPPAKKVYVNTNTGKIHLELNAEAEYDHDRKNGEQWPHLLIGQDWYGEDLVRIADMQTLQYRLDYTVTKVEDKSYQTADPALHCAQFVWYVTLQNRNTDSPDYGKYIWFGLNLFDNRTAGTSAAGFAAQDGGKEQNTGAFIYQPASAVWSDNGLVPDVGERKEVRFDLLAEAKIAYELAIERNFLGNTRFEDLYIGSTNMGFEVTGTYNIAAQLGNLGIVWKAKDALLPKQNKY